MLCYFTVFFFLRIAGEKTDRLGMVPNGYGEITACIWFRHGWRVALCEALLPVLKSYTFVTSSHFEGRLGPKKTEHIARGLHKAVRGNGPA